MPTSGTPGSYGSFIFNLLRSLHAIFHNGCTNYILTKSIQGFWWFFWFFGGFWVFLLFRAAPLAYGGSQARGRIGAVSPAYATGTAMQDLSHVCNLHHSLQQRQILNLLSEAGDQTHNLMFLVRFVSTAPWWELPRILFFPHPCQCLLSLVCFFEDWHSFFFYFYYTYLAAPTACGSSWTRVQTHASLWQCQILNPVCHKGSYSCISL